MPTTPISSEMCLACRGTKSLCGRKSCPILSDQWARMNLKTIPFSSDLSGSSPPAFFVGRQNYPHVLIGPMIPPIFGEEAFILDEPDLWFGKSIEEIIAYRQQLVRTTFKSNVAKLHDNPLVEVSREIVMGSQPVDTEAKLVKPPSLSLYFDPRIQPLGPSAEIKSVRITENPKVHHVIERIVGDTDYRASEGIVELHARGFSVTKINQLLSAGLLGEGKRRKLVPTRWSITATDDMISKAAISRIREYPLIDQYLVFESKYLDNVFMTLMTPDVWGFEQMEAWMPGSPWIDHNHSPVIITDYEFYAGRKNYAENVQGGYYAGRIAITEYLERIHRQAATIVFREIHEGYNVPLGVWQVRENMRNALKTPPHQCETITQAVELIGSKLRIPIKEWLNTSGLYKFLTKQEKLSKYLISKR